MSAILNFYRRHKIRPNFFILRNRVDHPFRQMWKRDVKVQKIVQKIYQYLASGIAMPHNLIPLQAKFIFNCNFYPISSFHCFFLGLDQHYGVSLFRWWDSYCVMSCFQGSISSVYEWSHYIFGQRKDSYSLFPVEWRFVNSSNIF